MEKIESFKDLHTWKQGHQLVLMIYKATENFPSGERYGLVDQLRRAAVSFTSNIAEGFSRRSYREKVQFYSTALGSLTEIQNQLLIAKDIGYLAEDNFQRMDNHSITVSKLTNGLIKKSKTLIQNS